jgi:transposase
MDMTYSLNFRQKVFKIRDKENLSMAEVAKRFDVGITSVMRWSKKIEPKAVRERPAIKLDMEALKKDIELYPDAYLIERAKRLNVSRNGVWYALKRLNVTYKKNASAPESSLRKTICILPKH